MNLINEKDFSKSSYIKELRNKKYCNYLKYIKSDYIKKTHSQILYTSWNNILYYKNLIKYTKNTYTKYYYVKLLIKHAELIKTIINKINELLGYLCKNTSKIIINDLKYDLITLHFFEYQCYKDSLDILSEIKIFYKSLHKYDIEDKIGVLNYKTNLSGIEYVKAKLEYNNKLDEIKKVEEIIDNYKLSHDDNILYEIKEIEKNNNIETFSNVSKKSKKSKKLIILLLILIITLFFIKKNI